MSLRKSKFRFVNHFFDYLEQIELFFEYEVKSAIVFVDTRVYLGRK